MSKIKFKETCDKCGKEFDILTEGQWINTKIPRCYDCQPKTKIFIKENCSIGQKV